jgi:hypothetical protein
MCVTSKCRRGGEVADRSWSVCLQEKSLARLHEAAASREAEPVRLHKAAASRET